MSVRYTRRHRDRCVESATYQTSSVQLDKDKGVLHNVKILGWDSRNNRKYSRRAVESSLPLYEGIKVNLNHAGDGKGLTAPTRDVRDRFGRLVNCRVTDEGLFGDLKYNTGHNCAHAFEWFAVNDASAIGLSHDAILQGPVTESGVRLVESIPKVFSVDVVAEPGTVKSLFESTMEDNPQVVEGSLEDHLCDAMAAIVRDKSLDSKVKKQKINKLLKLMMEDDGESESPAETMETEAMKEPADEGTESATTKALQAEIAQLKLDLDAFRAKEQVAKDTADAMELCNKAKLPAAVITPTFLQTMVTRGRESWEELVNDRRQILNPTPESAGRGAGTKPSVDDFVRQALGGK